MTHKQVEELIHHLLTAEEARKVDDIKREARASEIDKKLDQMEVYLNILQERVSSAMSGWETAKSYYRHYQSSADGLGAIIIKGNEIPNEHHHHPDMNTSTLGADPW